MTIFYDPPWETNSGRLMQYRSYIEFCLSSSFAYIYGFVVPGEANKMSQKLFPFILNLSKWRKKHGSLPYTLMTSLNC